MNRCSALRTSSSPARLAQLHKPLEPGNIVERKDRKLFTVRTEVRSKHGDSHLGTSSTTGRHPRLALLHELRRPALHPQEDLEKEGYSQYLKLFDKKK